MPAPAATHPTTCSLILLVESDPVQAQELAAALRQAGLRVLGPAATATEALALCRQEWPALAILAEHLPGNPDSIGLATQLTQLGRLPLIFRLEADQEPSPAGAAARERMLALLPLALLPKSCHLDFLHQIICQGLLLREYGEWYRARFAQ